MAKQKKKTMKRNTSPDDLLLPWLTRCLNEEKFEGMRWVDREKKIFYINWIHRSAERWKPVHVEIFVEWARHKGKTECTNYKQLKATFRCALNSKKELREIPKFKTKCKTRKYWQIITPDQKMGASTIKKITERKRQNSQKRGVKTEVEQVPSPYVAPTFSQNSPQGFDTVAEPSAMSDTVDMASQLPPFETFYPLTPPRQPRDINTEYSWKYSPVSDRSSWSPPAEVPTMESNICFSNDLFDEGAMYPFNTNLQTVPSVNNQPNQMAPEMNSSIWQMSCDNDKMQSNFHDLLPYMPTGEVQQNEQLSTDDRLLLDINIVNKCRVSDDMQNDMEFHSLNYYVPDYSDAGQSVVRSLMQLNRSSPPLDTDDAYDFAATAIEFQNVWI